MVLVVFYIMDKDYILRSYDDLSHFCHTGKFKYADCSACSKELDVIVKRFLKDCDRSKRMICLLLMIVG